MSTPEKGNPGGNELQIMLSLQRCELDAIQRRYVEQISGSTMEEAHSQAKRYLGDFGMPDLPLKVVLFEDTDEETGQELGGGLEFGLTELDPNLGLLVYGVRVRVYEMRGTEAHPLEGFRGYQSDEVARGVLGVAEACVGAGLKINLDLTHLSEEPNDRIIIDVPPL